MDKILHYNLLLLLFNKPLLLNMSQHERLSQLLFHIDLKIPELFANVKTPAMQEKLFHILKHKYNAYFHITSDILTLLQSCFH